MNLKLLFIIILNLVSMFMGAMVYLNNTKKRTNQFFLLLVISITMWVSTLYLSNAATDYLLLLNKLVFVSSSLIALSTVLLSIHFPSEDKNISINKYSLIILPTIVMFYLTMFTDQIVKNYKLVDWGTDIVTGNLYFLYPIYFFPHFLFSVWLLMGKYKKLSSTTEKHGIKLFIIGLVTGLGMGYLTNSLSYYIFGNYYYSQYGYYAVIVFVLMAGYAIIRHRLFSIRLILTEIGILIVTVSLFAQLLTLDNPSARLVNIIVLIFVVYGGLLLIKSVKDEVKRSEQIEKLNYRLEKDKKELLELDRMKDEFLQMATHELNTPITVIQGKLNMAIEEDMCHLDHKQKEFLEPVLNDTMRLADLSKDILNVARIDQNRLKLSVTESDLDSLIASIVSDFDIKAKEQGNSIAYIKLNKTIPKFIFDQTKIGEVISNLINNANKFTKNGKIAVTAKIKDDSVIVSVADTGVGIKKDEQDHLFQKFYQIGRFDPNNPQEQQGSGLGLFISKNIIELHGGRIWLESEEGRGSTFYFSLPLEYKESKEAERLHISPEKVRVL